VGKTYPELFQLSLDHRRPVGRAAVVHKLLLPVEPAVAAVEKDGHVPVDAELIDLHELGTAHLVSEGRVELHPQEGTALHRLLHESEVVRTVGVDRKEGKHPARPLEGRLPRTLDLSPEVQAIPLRPPRREPGCPS